MDGQGLHHFLKELGDDRILDMFKVSFFYALKLGFRFQDRNKIL